MNQLKIVLEQLRLLGEVMGQDFRTLRPPVLRGTGSAGSSTITRGCWYISIVISIILSAMK